MNRVFEGPDAVGSPAFALAGDAGWLPNPNGFDGAVAEVGVVPNENGAGALNVDGLTGVDPELPAVWANGPPGAAEGPNEKAGEDGVAVCVNGAEEPKIPGDAGG